MSEDYRNLREVDLFSDRDSDMPVGLDAADFVNPARKSAFDESLQSMKF